MNLNHKVLEHRNNLCSRTLENKAHQMSLLRNEVTWLVHDRVREVSNRIHLIIQRFPSTV